MDHVAYDAKEGLRGLSLTYEDIRPQQIVGNCTRIQNNRNVRLDFLHFRRQLSATGSAEQVIGYRRAHRGFTQNF